MARSEIADRSFEFARRIAILSEKVAARGYVARRIAGQLFDAASSIGANAEEAQAGQTKPDFLAKLATARKESFESRYWLRLLLATHKVTLACCPRLSSLSPCPLALSRYRPPGFFGSSGGFAGSAGSGSSAIGASESRPTRKGRRSASVRSRTRTMCGVSVRMMSV